MKGNRNDISTKDDVKFIVDTFYEKVNNDDNYKGSPFTKHLGLPVDTRHFEHWIDIFCRNIDVHFAGEMAEQTKLRAKAIAMTFESKLKYLQNQQYENSSIS